MNSSYCHPPTHQSLSCLHRICDVFQGKGRGKGRGWKGVRWMDGWLEAGKGKGKEGKGELMKVFLEGEFKDVRR